MRKRGRSIPWLSITWPTYHCISLFCSVKPCLSSFCVTAARAHLARLFATTSRAGSLVSASCLYSSTSDIFRCYFWPHAPLPHCPFQVLRLISCCFLGTFLYDLTAYPSTIAEGDVCVVQRRHLAKVWLLLVALVHGKFSAYFPIRRQKSTSTSCWIRLPLSTPVCRSMQESLSRRKQHTLNECMFRQTERRTQAQPLLPSWTRHHLVTHRFCPASFSVFSALPDTTLQQQNEVLRCNL